jgi:hypothetical protein
MMEKQLIVLLKFYKIRRALKFLQQITHLTRILFILLGILYSNMLNSQQLSFHGQLVDTIEITSVSGYYHFDDKGTTTSTFDYYYIGFDKNMGNYNVLEYSREFYKGTYRPDTFEIKREYVNKYKGNIISKANLDSLLTAFSVGYKKPTFENLAIDKQEFLSLTDKKHIRKIAKACKSNWQFKRKYSTKERNKLIFKNCQNIDTLNLFLANAFDTTGYIMITDGWDAMHVYITTIDSSFSFEGKWPNKFKQPWYNHSDTSDFFFSTPIVNLNINRFLIAILPSKFHGLRSIELNSLIDEYIIWYLERSYNIKAYWN